MRFPAFLRLLVASGLGLTTSLATTDHLITVFQVLDPESGGADISEVTYVTSYGAGEETVLSAMCWPSVLGTPHDDVEKRDRNWASVLGIKTQLLDREEGWKLTIDLTKFKPWPEFEEHQEHVTIIEELINVASMNLLSVGVFDCAVSVLGDETQPMLKELEVPKVLNPVADVWGKWKYPDLRKDYPDGDLQELAARGLTNQESLHTLLLILSSETHSEKGTLAMTAFLLELLARTGDDRFAKTLDTSESLVQQRIARAIVSESASLGVFPKTAAFVKKQSAGKQP